jgi:hypothetical protein
MAVLDLTLGGAEWLQFLALTGPLLILAAPFPPLPSIFRSTKCKFPPSCGPKEDDEFSGTKLKIVFFNHVWRDVIQGGRYLRQWANFVV